MIRKIVMLNYNNSTKRFLNVKIDANETQISLKLKSFHLHRIG